MTIGNLAIFIIFLIKLNIILPWDVLFIIGSENEPKELLFYRTIDNKINLKFTQIAIHMHIDFLWTQFLLKSFDTMWM